MKKASKQEVLETARALFAPLIEEIRAELRGEVERQLSDFVEIERRVQAAVEVAEKAVESVGKVNLTELRQAIDRQDVKRLGATREVKAVVTALEQKTEGLTRLVSEAKLATGVDQALKIAETARDQAAKNAGVEHRTRQQIAQMDSLLKGAQQAQNGLSRDVEHMKKEIAAAIKEKVDQAREELNQLMTATREQSLGMHQYAQGEVKRIGGRLREVLEKLSAQDSKIELVHDALRAAAGRK